MNEETRRLIAAHVPSEPPIGCFQILAQKFASRTFDSEFLACLLTVSAWLVGRAGGELHPVFGNVDDPYVDESDAYLVTSVCCEILEEADQPIPAGGPASAIVIRLAIKLLWDALQSDDLKKILDALLKGAA